MNRKPSRRRATSVSHAAERVDQLHAELKRDHDVVDIKFAFGEVKGVDRDVIFGAVGVALKAAVQGRTAQFKGIKDSYARKRLGDK